MWTCSLLHVPFLSKRKTGTKSILKPYTDERLFKFEAVDKRGKKGGYDTYTYRENVLKLLLYPSYLQVQAANPNKAAWLVEDNASSYKKAAKQLEEYRKIHGIKKVDWPANSPDLHPIEDIWGPEKSDLSPRWIEVSRRWEKRKEKSLGN